MTKVLVETSEAKCSHLGSVELSAGQDVLKVGGSLVLVGSLEDASIVGCTNTPPPASRAPCTSIKKQSGGRSKVLKVNGQAVVLADASGKTNGKPNGTWSVSTAVQDVLESD